MFMRFYLEKIAEQTYFVGFVGNEISFSEETASKVNYVSSRDKTFAKHHWRDQALGVAFYFPEAHQPWQRGRMKI